MSESIDGLEVSCTRQNGWATGVARTFHVSLWPGIVHRRVIGRDGPGQDFDEPLAYVWVPLWPIPALSGAMTLLRYRKERRAARTPGIPAEGALPQDGPTL